MVVRSEVWGGGGIHRQSTENSESTESILCDTMMMDTCHHTFVQNHRMHNSNSDT